MTKIYPSVVNKMQEALACFLGAVAFLSIAGLPTG